LRRVLLGFGMLVCRTPRRSPESNGLAEAFFGTFKRDYVYEGELETFEGVGRKLPGWIGDYNEVAPHSALGMKSPAQFYRDWSAKISKPPVQN
ncbi:MAG: integrase core domain-containing protein, partial [Elusimicrobiota bacterium]